MLHWIEMFGGNTVSGWEHRLSHAAPLDSHAICFHRMNNAQVDAALVAINARLCSREGVSVDDDGSVKFCAGLGAAKEIQNLLYKSKAWTLAQSLIGRGRVNRVDHVCDRQFKTTAFDVSIYVPLYLSLRFQWG
eukprot:m.518177 g.518177  ORF g.518177 m.518177 type:complete len:134 (+) comp21939_c0_seq4:169-570(+)